MKQIIQSNKVKILSLSSWVGLFVLFYIVGLFIPEGFDWIHYFSKGRVHPIWTPWTIIVLKFLTWPLVVAITLYGIVLRSYKFNHSPIPMAFAILSLPTLWVLFMGNLDGLVIFGLMFLPLGIPLVLIKPQLSAFAVLAKKPSLLAALMWGIISVIIWGLWPMNFMMALTPEWKVEWIQDITLFPWGIIIALPLMWYSRGDEDLLMAAGSFATPHLFPYHFILLMPALGRMKLPWMILTWIISWTPLSANWIGPIGWHMGNLLGLCFWAGIYFSNRDSPVEKVSEV